MGWYHLSLLFLVITACIFQQFTPTFHSLCDAGILLVPLVFLCCSVTVGAGPMLLLAFIAGFLWDAQHVITPLPAALLGNPEVYEDTGGDVRFGYSIILYALMGFSCRDCNRYSAKENGMCPPCLPELLSFCISLQNISVSLLCVVTS